MIRVDIIKRLFLTPRQLLNSRNASQNAINIQQLEEESNTEVEADEDAQLREQEIQLKRNKSRLRESDRNILHNSAPYAEAMHWSHGTIRYQRKLYGKFGTKSNVDPSLAWPSKEEIREKLDYEKVAFPHTIPELIEISSQKRLEKESKISKRQEEIVAKVEKLGIWKAELIAKIAKKESEANEAKNRKERLVEEVRRHFGYLVDVRDEKFKEMLEKKEKEQKKAMKEARKKVSEEKMIIKLTEKTEELLKERTKEE